jgi:hypothetical protein
MKKRKFHTIDLVTVKDAFGTEWHVHEARSTKYGFDVLYGRKENPGPYEGSCRLIYTSELKAFWEKHSIRCDGTIFDLPSGRSTLKRARQALGFNWDKDSEKFWRKHKSDLMALKPREFEEKYKEREITADRMKNWRFRLCGARARPLGWWRIPEVLKLLLSERTLVAVGIELQIGTSHACRLRHRAKRAFEIRSGILIQITEDCKDQEPRAEAHSECVVRVN